MPVRVLTVRESGKTQPGHSPTVQPGSVRGRPESASGEPAGLQDGDRHGAVRGTALTRDFLPGLLYAPTVTKPPSSRLKDTGHCRLKSGALFLCPARLCRGLWRLRRGSRRGACPRPGQGRTFGRGPQLRGLARHGRRLEFSGGAGLAKPRAVPAASQELPSVCHRPRAAVPLSLLFILICGWQPAPAGSLLPVGRQGKAPLFRSVALSEGAPWASCLRPCCRPRQRPELDEAGGIRILAHPVAGGGGAGRVLRDFCAFRWPA